MKLGRFGRKRPKEQFLSADALKVLRVLMAHSGTGMTASEIGSSIKSSPGEVYPVLARLETASWITSRFATKVKPRKRVYELATLTVELMRIGTQFKVFKKGEQ